MSIPFPLYAKIKNNYCLTYFGNCAEYLVQLRALRPFMEAAFPGVRVYIAHKDVSAHIFAGCERTLTRQEFDARRGEFAYVRELACDMRRHPVEAFLQESDVPLGPVPVPPPPPGDRTVLLTRGTLPTKSLTPAQVEKIKKQFKSVDVDGDVAGAGRVVGVECEGLYEAACRGVPVTLVPTGIGENLFRKMFINSTVMDT